MSRGSFYCIVCEREEELTIQVFPINHASKHADITNCHLFILSKVVSATTKPISKVPLKFDY